MEGRGPPSCQEERCAEPGSCATWICIRDMWNSRLAAIDCCSGGAQAIFSDLRRAFARAGWKFCERYFDVYMRRGSVRWELSIGGNPYEDQGAGWGMKFRGPHA